MRTRVPLAMIVGLVLTVALHLWAIGREAVHVHYGDDVVAYAQFIARWEQIARGVEWSAAVLLAAGWAELARRSHGRTRVLLSIVVLAHGCVVADLVAWNLVQALVDDPAGWFPWFDRLATASAAIFVAQAVLLSIATSAWRRVRWAAVGLVVTAVVAGAPVVNASAAHFAFIEHALMSAVGLALVHLGYVACVYLSATRFIDEHPFAPSQPFAALGREHPVPTARVVS